MNRLKQLERMEKIVWVAIECFLAQGFRGTKISDIAKNAQIGKGSIYNYFQSKDALVDFLFKSELLYKSKDEWPEIPVKTPREGATVKFLKTYMKSQGVDEYFQGVINSECSDPEAELKQVVLDSYRLLDRMKYSTMFMEHIESDLPEIKKLYDKWNGDRMSWFIKYVQSRMEEKKFRELPSAIAAARFMNQTIAWFAMHRHGHPNQGGVNDEKAEEMVSYAILHTFIPDW